MVIRDFSIWWLTENTENNIFINLKMIKELLSVMPSLRAISLSFIRTFSGLRMFRILHLRKIEFKTLLKCPREENELLTSEFTISEVKDAVFQMEHNKAPGPDGFPAEFYQVFWEVIKDDLMALFTDFHKEDLNLFSLNFGIITLIPKVQEATKIQQYRPICVLNVSFKIFTKVATNR